MNETIEQRSPKPPGLIPKQVQNYVILGVATVLIGIIWLTSGSGRKAVKSQTTPGNTLESSRLNQAKLEEYKNQLAAQERLLREQQALLLGQPTPVPPGDLLTGPPDATSPAAAPAVAPQEALATQLRLEQQKKDYQSQFATNLALSYRPEPKAASESENFKEFLKVMARSPTVTTNDQPLQPGPAMSPPEDLRVKADRPAGEHRDRQVPQPAPASLATGIPSASAGLSPSGSPSLLAIRPGPSALASSSQRELADSPPEKGARRTQVDDDNQASGPQFRVLAGTMIETVLLNRINSDFSGPVNCLVTSPVYSHDRQRVLIPEGSKVLGETQKLAALGQKRVAVAFHRLIMPDGFSVSLDQFQGLNQIGETALQDKVNHHYLRIFGMSVALGLISGFSNRGVTYYGPGTSGTDLYRAGIADSLSQSSQRVLDRYINILPTVTITEGHRVKIYLTHDLLLPDVTQHRMPGDLRVEPAFTRKES
ncbi:MAG: TrbI/VirB10 family protein [Acidobacteriota bacterium]